MFGLGFLLDLLGAGGIKKWLAIIVIGGLLFGGIWAGCRIQAHRIERLQVEKKAAELNLKIEKKDRIDEEKIKALSDDDLAEFLRTGMWPKH